jgi:tetratricopeptide (TPR) repeat protein
MGPPLRVGDYLSESLEIRQVLQGGMGIVYLVFDPQARIGYAAKTFRDEVAPWKASGQRFAQEALAWANVGAHPHITSAFGVFWKEDRPFLLLEYVPGGNLADWIGTPQLVGNPTQVQRLAVQLCDGMIHAFSRGVKVHRDLKPRNCLLTLEGDLKLTDFGLAKIFDDLGPAHWTAGAAKAPETPATTEDTVDLPLRLGLSHTGAAAGTPAYMAPEQFADAKHVDVRADVYSFGVLLFEMASGRLPFRGKNWADLERLHRTEKPPDPRTGDPNLDTLVRDCLAKSPAERPPDFRAVRGRLAPALRQRASETVPAVVSLSAEDWLTKGFTLMGLTRTAEALLCMERSLELEPTCEAWATRGKLLLDLGRAEDALSSLDRALECEPGLAAGQSVDEPVNRELLAQILTWKARALLPSEVSEDYEKALACADRALELNARNVEAWLVKAELLAVVPSAEVEACYARALEIAPRNPAIWLRKGNFLLCWKDKHALAESFLRNSEPAELDADECLAMRLGLLQDALACFQEAERLGDQKEAPDLIARCRQELERR